MSFSAFIIVAFRNLLQAKRRSALLSTALALVSMLLVLLMALSQGLTDTIIHSATTLISGHVNVGGFYKAKPTDAYPMITRVDEIRKVVTDTLPDVELMVDRNRGWGKIISATASQQTGMAGIDVNEETALVEKIRLAKESEYKAGGREEVLGKIEDLSQPNTALIFADQAERLEVGIGDIITISTESMGGSMNTADVRVVAVARDIGFVSNWSLFVPKKVLRDLYQNNENTSGVVMVFLKDPRRAGDAMAELRLALGDAGFTLMDRQADPFWRKFEVVSGEDWTGQKLDLTVWEDEIGNMKTVVNVLDSMAVLLIAILLIIIIVGITNTMWIAVRERTGEIGTLRAIGMGRWSVVLLFVLEAGILGLFATSFGAAAGALLAYGIDAAGIPVTIDAFKAVLMSETLELSVMPGQVVRAVLTFTFFTIVAALWPAMRAGQLQPITAIHRVG